MSDVTSNAEIKLLSDYAVKKGAAALFVYNSDAKIDFIRISNLKAASDECLDVLEGTPSEIISTLRLHFEEGAYCPESSKDDHGNIVLKFSTKQVEALPSAMALTGRYVLQSNLRPGDLITCICHWPLAESKSFFRVMINLDLEPIEHIGEDGKVIQKRYGNLSIV